MESATERDGYTCESIQVLEGLEAVRKRPGMYAGDTTDGSGLEHLLWGVVDNAIDQHLARRAANLRVDVRPDGWIEVEDDGPGLPVEPTRPRGRPAMEVLFSEYLVGGCSGERYLSHAYIGPRAVGVDTMVVSALSARLEVENRYRGQLWRAAFERGHAVHPASCEGPAARSGLRIRYRPDPTIFTKMSVDLARVERRLRELAWLHPLLAIRFQGQVLPGRGGLPAWVREEAGDALEGGVLAAALRTIDDVYVDLAFGWRAAGGPQDIESFVNQERVPSGTHVDGFWSGLRRIAGVLGCDANRRVVRELLSPGLVARIHIGLNSASFGSGTHDRLKTPLAAEAVSRAVLDAAELRWKQSALAVMLRERLRIG
ncbi:MAG: hypothetical protein HOV80_11635 [Polyangiaceae bacterium]|nr:hypothetical protein [Polyangiaceae bacterium]